ncbi:hypothetical protein GSU75_02566 [Pseudomonas savastanoi pv. phaseolicola]|nr:hypothetical protein [Pseudomonas savastanoi pv. phaseolicola]
MAERPMDLNMKNAEQDDFAPVAPGMPATAQAAVEQDQFEQVSQQQYGTRHVDHHAKRAGRFNDRIGQDYQPEAQHQDFFPAPKTPSSPAPLS